MQGTYPSREGEENLPLCDPEFELRLRIIGEMESRTRTSKKIKRMGKNEQTFSLVYRRYVYLYPHGAYKVLVAVYHTIFGAFKSCTKGTS